MSLAFFCISLILCLCLSSKLTPKRNRANRIEGLIANIMYDGKIPEDTHIIKNIKPLVPAIEETATQLRSLSNLNRTVHLPTYNKLIAEAALDLAAAT